MVRIALIAAVFAGSPALAQEAVTLKPGPGQDVVSTNCTVCHTLNYIRMNAPFLTPDGWKAEVTKMQKALGAPFDDATAAEIVKYLSANYAAPPKS
jgi:mono/diheme cytochrome c family protein